MIPWGVPVRWTPLPRDPNRGDNHLRWDAGGVEVVVFQPGVEPCDPPETCANEEGWVTLVDGVSVDEGPDDAVWSETPFLARTAAERAVKAWHTAKPIQIDFSSDQAIANTLGGIRRGGYNLWEAYRWATANDRNGSFEGMLTDQELVELYIDEKWDEIIAEGNVSVDEAEGRAPGSRQRDDLLRQVFGRSNPDRRRARLKARLMRG